MKTSDSGLRFIAGWEGLRKQLYNDDWKPLATSKGHCTIGVGHLVHTGPCTYQDPREFPFFNGITEAQAIELMRTDVPRYEAVVSVRARVPLNQNQFDALVDFCFNTGGGYPAVWSALNTGGDVCAVLMRTAISATGVVPDWATDALVRRRKAECALFNKPYVAPAPTPEEDEMFVRYPPALGESGLADFFTGKQFVVMQQDGVMQLAVDFPKIPATAKAIDLEVVLGGNNWGNAALVFKDGDGRYAGQFDKMQPAGVVRVIPKDRACRFIVTGAALTVASVRAVGYLA